MTGAAASSTRYDTRAPGKARFSARGIGVVKTTSPIRRSRMRRTFTLLFDRGLVEQHDGDVVLDREDPLAGGALQGRAIFDQLHLGFALWAGEYLEQFLVDSHR